MTLYWCHPDRFPQEVAGNFYSRVHHMTFPVIILTYKETVITLWREETSQGSSSAWELWWQLPKTLLSQLLPLSLWAPNVSGPIKTSMWSKATGTWGHLREVRCQEPAWGIPPMAKVMRKGAWQNAKARSGLEETPLGFLEHLPPKPESACLTALCFPPILLTLQGAAIPNHLSLEKVNLELQLTVSCI